MPKKNSLFTTIYIKNNLKMRTIKLTESDLHKLISEAVSKVLVSEAIDIAKGVPEQVKKQYLKKMISEYPDLDPDGFFWVGNNLKHNGKKKPKGSGAQRIAKPKGMGDIEFITKFAPKYNKRLAAGLTKMKEYSGGEEELWEPLDVGHIRSGEVAEEFSNRYYISNFGGIALSNPGNTSWCHVFVPYFDKSTKQFQINLRIYDAEGNEIDHLCPAVASLVRRVFGNEAADNLKELERMKLRKGEAVMSGEETDF